MGREDVHAQIQAEMRSGTTTSGQQADVTLCQYCGQQLAGPDADLDIEGEYVIHRVPEHGGDQHRSVLYCSTGCFQDAIDELFSVEE